MTTETPGPKTFKQWNARQLAEANVETFESRQSAAMDDVAKAQRRYDDAGIELAYWREVVAFYDEHAFEKTPT